MSELTFGCSVFFHLEGQVDSVQALIFVEGDFFPLIRIRGVIPAIAMLLVLCKLTIVLATVFEIHDSVAVEHPIYLVAFIYLVTIVGILDSFAVVQPISPVALINLATIVAILDSFAVPPIIYPESNISGPISPYHSTMAVSQAILQVTLIEHVFSNLIFVF